jgi:hypothetical protein
MDQKEMLKQMVTFNQTTFNNTFSALTLLQEQFEQVAKTVLEQANWLPAEGRHAIENYVESFKTGRDNFKKYVDESYQNVEKYFAD